MERPCALQLRCDRTLQGRLVIEGGKLYLEIACRSCTRAAHRTEPVAKDVKHRYEIEPLIDVVKGIHESRAADLVIESGA